ncbi:conserved protein of unknown function (plasmid) [Thauera humireducens]|uniref:helix-turn-helix domain-containing protein n=1 Tax=Thauera humireducens TaxID=1134435 RepID=UPI002467A038|nr:helix-turn-helix domain-containing protein [Thauera humireducens]CAH1749542.1 conserved protein of unknown function [Thauera humireducens]
MKLGITFRDDTPEILRFDKDDIRSIVLGGVVAHVKMIETYVGTDPKDTENRMQVLGEQLDEMPIWKAYSVIYDYANNGIFPPDRSALDDYLRMAISFRMELVYANEFHCIDIGSPKPNPSTRYRVMISTGSALEILLCGFMARWKLDVAGNGSDDADDVRFWGHMFERIDCDLLSLSEIALLADIQERSVRNYTHSTRAEHERLKTVKVGGRTYVRPEDAKSWLTRRRRFIPTRFPEAVVHQEGITEAH